MSGYNNRMSSSCGSQWQNVVPPNIVRRPTQKRTWKDRFMRKYGMGIYADVRELSPMPYWLIGKSVLLFFVALVLCLLSYYYVPDANLLLTAIISIIFFFYGGLSISRNNKKLNEKQFLKNIFVIGFVIRVVWILYMYFVFNPNYYYNTFGDPADVEWYMPFGKDLAAWMVGGALSLSDVIDRNIASIDDVGYPMWLGIIYTLTGGVSDVFIPMILKSILSACCAIFAYYIAKRHFGESVARISAIFVCLNPNMIYWCASMMKESEMVFLCCLSVDKLDKALSSGNKLTFGAIWPGLFAGIILLFFRSALGIVVLLAVMVHVVLASQKVIGWGKKVLVGLILTSVLMLSVGDRIINQSKELMEAAQSDSQQTNMEWRSKRAGGNEFAKYAGAAVFAPLIFTIPFPTFNQANESQLVQVQLSGGSYIKNVLSFFVIVVLFLMLISGEWRKCVFILAYTCGYLVVLVFSGFAQSGRFHMPIIPMLMILAAYGIQVAKHNKRLKRGFTYVLVGEVLICLAWNWFKLKGRGMI